MTSSQSSGSPLPAAPRGVDGCLLARFAGGRLPDWLRRWLDAGLAGVVLFASNIDDHDQLQTLMADLRAHREDVIVAVDEEGGLVSRLEARTGSSFPGNGALGVVDDLELTRQVAAAIGGMLAATGIGLDLAPVADLGTSSLSPVIGVRSFGSSPDRVAAHTAAFVSGLQGQGVAACAKHFPGHGRADADSHRELPAVTASLAVLREADLVPFRAAIAAGVRCIMTAHVLFPAVDARPATTSRRWLTDILRAELGFRGVVSTDALDMAAIGDSSGQATGAVGALAAGADLLCLPSDPAAQWTARAAVAAAVRSGELTADRIEEAAGRVAELAAWTIRQADVRAAARARLGTGPGTVSGTEPGAAALSAADRELGLRAARRALTADVSTPAVTSAPVAPFVVDAGWLRGTGVGESAASLLTIVQAMCPGTDGVRVDADSAELRQLSELMRRGQDRPLVLVVRDARRRPWQRELIGAVLAVRPDVIVVGTGGDDRALAGANYLGTHGPARPNLTAAAELLAAMLAGRPADPQDGR